MAMSDGAGDRVGAPAGAAPPAERRGGGERRPDADEGDRVIFSIDGQDGLVLRQIGPPWPITQHEPFVDVGIGEQGMVLDLAAGLQLAAILLEWSFRGST